MSAAGTLRRSRHGRLPLETPHALSWQARGGRTPVPYFLSGEALLGTSAGDLLAAADAARASWRRVCAVPHPITCMAAPGQSPSSVMH